MSQVRVRFAPSPTGPLHIGGVRTALYNYLFARQHGGTFVLRIEDTDSQRYVAGSEQYIVEALEWCGLRVDEGVGVGGPHAPYRQSERRGIYQEYARQLVSAGWAYYAFDSASSLEALRKSAEASGAAFAYDARTRADLDNSLRCGLDVAERRVADGEPYVVRFKVPPGETVGMTDLIRGDLRVSTDQIDDKVLFKSADGLPTYHLANIVDDHLMLITHVIRGEEWLPSLPLHYLLYRALGWEASRPAFAHLPLLLKPQGQGKLSKRDGDKLGFPVFPLDWSGPDGERTRGFREEGYLPDAFVNMLALLGWNPGTEQELFTLDELCEAFSLDKVSKSGARYNPDKARWFNQQYLRRRTPAELAELTGRAFSRAGIWPTAERRAAAIALVQERATFPADYVELTRPMFERPFNYDAASVRKFWHGPIVGELRVLRDSLALIPLKQPDFTEASVKSWASVRGLSMGQLMSVLRIAIWGHSNGPSIFHIIAFLGRQECLDRIDNALQRLPRE